MIKAVDLLRKFMFRHFPFFASADTQDEMWRKDKLTPGLTCEDWISDFSHDWRRLREKLPFNNKLKEIDAFHDELRKYLELRLTELHNRNVVTMHRNILDDRIWKKIQREAKRIALREKIPFYVRTSDY
ncbi:MAG: hypothetical protein K940chlam7_01705 [Chlamydiae bacterium]|nr:hypothetical protein [Chlamydiota bacterium]